MSEKHEKEPDPEVVKYCELKEMAKSFIHNKEFPQALNFYQEAYKIHQSEVLKKKIDKIMGYLKSINSKHVTETSGSKLVKGLTSEKACKNEGENSLESKSEPKEKESVAKYSELKGVARVLLDSGEYAEALQYYQEAYKINQSENLKTKIEELKAQLKAINPDHVTQANASDLVSCEKRKKNEPKLLPKPNEEPQVLLVSDSIAKKQIEDATKICELKEIAKILHVNGEYEEALQYYKEVYKIRESDGLKKKIEKLKEYLKKQNPELAVESNELYPSPKPMEVALKEDISYDDGKVAEGTKPDTMTVKYTEMIEIARTLFRNHQYAEALQYYEEAYKIHQVDRVKAKIEKIKAHLGDEHEQQEDEDYFPDLVDEELGHLSYNPNDRNGFLEGGLEALEFNSMMTKYRDLTEIASTLFDSQEYSEALLYYQEAFKIQQTDDIKKKIVEIKAHVGEDNFNLLEDSGNEIFDGFSLNKELYEKLYPYQKEGVKWMLKLHHMNKGGILADDMGLGKTVQVITFISGLIKSDLIKTTLIVMPVSLISNWESEFKKWNCHFKVLNYHGAGNQRENNLARIQNKGGILLTSYGTLVSAVDKLSVDVYGQKYIWDYIILDEGHKIKNPTKTTKAAHEIKAFHRLVLSGTPLQNSLKELWALYDFCHQGTLLGNFTTFKNRYENPINRSREKDASSGQRALGNQMAENLRNLIAPYFLRRTKADTIETKENVDPGDKNACARLPRKNEFVVWLFLSDQQIHIYEQFLKSDEVKQILMSTKSPLVQLVVLKKICDHPRLFTKNACQKLSLDGSNPDTSLNDSQKDTVSINVEPALLLKESGKMLVLITLLENLRTEGHRTLVFSMSRKILDIIEKILRERHWKIMRLDGTITKMSERQARINTFQSSPNYPVFLLTTQVGGVGLTLTEADRVIIYDPSWNPANDAQAVDRAYRIGQKKDVVVYRLITCGTIEEKIYRRQIFKDSITRQATCSNVAQNNDPHRYFSQSELRELFVLDNPKESKTQEQLEKLHAHNRKATPELKAHINFLLSFKNVFGISDHDLMFKGNLQEDSAANDVVMVHDPFQQEDYINRQVEEAQQQLKLDSINNAKLAMQKGTYKTSYFSKNKGNIAADFNPMLPPAPKNNSFPYKNDYYNDYDAEVIDLDPIFTEDVDEEDSLIKDVSFVDLITPKMESEKYFDPLYKSSGSSENTSQKVDSQPLRKNVLKPNPIKSFFQKIAESQKLCDTEPGKNNPGPPKSLRTECEKSYFQKIRESNMLSPIHQNKLSPKIKNSGGIAPITSYFTKASTPKSGTSCILPPSPDIFDSSDLVSSPDKKCVSQKIAECITIDSDSEDGLMFKRQTIETSKRESLDDDCGINAVCVNLESPKPGCSTSYLNEREFKPTTSKKRNLSFESPTKDGDRQLDESEESLLNLFPKRKKHHICLSDSDND